MTLYAGPVDPVATDGRDSLDRGYGVTITDDGRNHRVGPMKRDVLVIVVVS